MYAYPCTNILPPSVVTVDWAGGEDLTSNSPVRDLPRNGWNWNAEKRCRLCKVVQDVAYEAHNLLAVPFHILLEASLI